MSLSFLTPELHGSILALVERAPQSQKCFSSVDDFACFAVDEYSECDAFYEQAGNLEPEQFAELFKELATILGVSSPIS